ncbi:MAG TPA: penicillin acylase family protein [Gaiellaceae bacterium]|nr:penicillin acylase family protein [Gaiellaceae bacterium]
MRRLATVTLAGLVLTVLTAAAATAPRKDYAAVALNVLPPGQNGSLVFNRNTTDQAQLYECLTPLFDRVRAADLGRCFKDASLGMKGKPARVQRPRKGVVIERDRWGVPHITGKTAADVAFGAGWVTIEDRGLLLDLIRGPARGAALDIPGISPVELALSGKQLVPSLQGEAQLSQQLELLSKAGRRGARMLTVVRAYVAGMNASLKKRGLLFAPYTPRDVVAIAALLTARFGANGGSEIRRAMFLDALQKKLGTEPGRAVFDDLRAADDAEAPTIGPGRFAYQLPPPTAPGSVVIDDGSFQPAAVSGGTTQLQSHAASNALLIGAQRSKTGRPILVGGPQVGYFFPQFFMEIDLHGGGFDARGALLPGLPFVVIGRGPDYAWSATSSQADNTDVFAETLCGDDRHYLHLGTCREMTELDAGTLRSTGATDQRLNLLQTVHGPVLGYATVGGKRVALSLKRSTRGREVLSGLPIMALNTGQVTSAKDFVATAVGIEGMFNFIYADDRDIAHVTAGRLPVRSPGTDPSLPTVGTGEYEWRGFLGAKAHPQTINPGSGVIVDWNSKPARGWGAADDNWSYGSVQRKALLTAALPAGKLTVAQVVAASNKASTQDLRVMEVWPAIADVLATGPPPSPLERTAADLLTAWRALGGSRLDRDLDGRIDHPGAAIMDAAWPRIARAVMRPVLGDLVERLAQLHTVSDDAGAQGSAYIDGWYGYVEKDLRAVLGRSVSSPYTMRYCGAGKLDWCRAALWEAIAEASKALTAKHTSDPTTWWADARAERINFTTGLIRDTMSWTNRPTFQQVMSFESHRKR